MPITTLSPDDSAGLSACLALRRDVFIHEQQVPEAEEMDGLDGDCLHVLARTEDGTAEGAPVGTARLRLGQDGRAKIQRVAVARHCRGTGLGRRLMAHVLAEAAARGARQAVLGAQLHALGFYESLGFVAEGPEFDDAGIAHRMMVLPLDRHDPAAMAPFSATSSELDA